MSEAVKVGGVRETDQGAHAGRGCDLGRWSREGGTGADRVGTPVGSMHLFLGVVHGGDGCTRGQKGCCRVGLQEGGCVVQL